MLDALSNIFLFFIVSYNILNFLRNTGNIGLAGWLKELSTREEARMKRFGFKE